MESTEQVSEDLPSQVYPEEYQVPLRRERGRRPSTRPLRKAAMNLTHPDAGVTLIPLLGVTRGCLCLQAHQQNHRPRKISPALGTDRATVADPPRILCHSFGSWKEPPERSPSSPQNQLSNCKMTDNTETSATVGTTDTSMSYLFFYEWEHRTGKMCPFSSLHLSRKMEKVTPGQGLSEKLRDLIKSRRIYKSTSLNTHPTPCLCKTHLERGSTQKSSPPPGGKAQHDRSKGVTGASSVSNLRSSFESGAT